MSSETCARCGSAGQDRRTLRMACFYAMEELGVPFEREVLLDAGGRPVVLRAGAVTCAGELTPVGLYTLRVCKRCRGEWMRAAKRWYEDQPEGEDHDADDRPAGGCGSGIFVRDRGAIREITREEWDARKKEADGDVPPHSQAAQTRGPRTL